MFASRRITMGGDVFRDDYSVSLDGGDDYLTVANNVLLYPNDAQWSISIWFKAENDSEDNYIISGGDESDKGFFAVRMRGDDSGKIRTFFKDFDNSQELAVNTSITGLNDDTWHHYAAVLSWSSKTIHVYIDGFKDVSATNTNIVTLSNNADEVHIGKRFKIASSSGTYEFTGSMGDIAIYNRFLTSAEILRMYNNREPFDHSSWNRSNWLQAWWRMGDGLENGKGATIYDMSQNSFDATIINSEISGGGGPL